MLEDVNGGTASEKLRNEQEAFKKVPLIYRAVRLRCDSITRVPVKIFENGVEVDDWQFQDEIGFKKWLWRSEASLLLRGASFTVKLKNEYGSDKGIELLNPFSVIIKVDADDNIFFQQQINGKTYPATGYWDKEDMVYLNEYNSTDDIGAGDSATKVAMDNARVSHYVTFFSSQFFGNGAMPVTLVTLPEGTKPDEVKRVENFFARAIQGVRNAFRVMGVSGETKVTVLTPDIKSLDLTNVDARTIDNIAWAFDIPKTVLTSDSANYATAETEYNSFISQTIVSRCHYYEQEIKRQFKEYGIEVQFNPQEMHEMQKDENQRADALTKYVQAGMRLEVACSILGIDIPEEFIDEIKNTPKATVTEKVPGPVPAPAGPDAGAVKADLQLWERKAVKRLKEGESAQVEFKSAHIPAPAIKSIHEALGGAKTPREVNNIFSSALESVDGPLFIKGMGRIYIGEKV